MSGVALALLAELRAAGCSVWIEPEQDDPTLGILVMSPEARPVAWPTDVEQAIEALYDELYAAIAAEDASQVH